MRHPDARRSRSPARATTGPRSSALAASLDLGERVRFLGRISEAEKLALLRRAWALVFASPKEGWGITNLEAAACGTPVVASNSPGIRESVRDGETGYLVPHGDARGDGRGDGAASPAIAALVARLGVQARALRRDVHLGARRRTRRRRTSIACSPADVDPRMIGCSHAPTMKVGAIFEQVRELLELERVARHRRARSRRRRAPTSRARASRSPATSSASSPSGCRCSARRRSPTSLARRRRRAARTSRSSSAFPCRACSSRRGSSCRPTSSRRRRRRGVADPALGAQDQRVLQPHQALARRRSSRRTTTLHGSLADVYGVGLLFIGQSGIGKSECVLDLVERGHRLVADDLVIVRAPRQRHPDRPRPRAAAALHGDSRRRARRHPGDLRHPRRAPAEAHRGRRAARGVATTTPSSSARGSTARRPTILGVELPQHHASRSIRARTSP